RALLDRSFDGSDGKSAHDGFYKPQAGFRLDWKPAADTVMVAGNFYYGAEDEPGDNDAPIEGRNLQVSWAHQLSGDSSFQLSSYYDQSRRAVQGGGAGFSITTYDFEAQHNFTLGSWNNIAWGAGERLSAYSIVDRISDINSLL